MKFTIDRGTWWRGKDVPGSELVRYDGMKCCIGFVGEQCGVQTPHMLAVGGISGIVSLKEKEKFPEWMHDDSEEVFRAYEANDNLALNDGDREIQLKKIFEANGDEIEFVG
jgi:hypothetical protein